MKHYCRKILCLCCLLCLLAAGCGKNKYANSPYTGTWSAISAEYNGVELSQQDMGGVYVMVLEQDGTASMDDGTEAQPGKWEELDGGGIRLDEDDDLILKDVEGNLVLEMDGVTFTFAKQGASTVGTEPAAEPVPAAGSTSAAETAPAAETTPAAETAPAAETTPAAETAPAAETVPEAGTASAAETASSAAAQ